MPPESTATCTSGEPVSPSFAPYSEINSFLRSTVIDIRSSSSKVEDTERSQLSCLNRSKRNWLAVSSREIDRKPLQIVAVSFFRKTCEQICSHQNRIAAAQPDRIRTRYGQRRDAVQRGRNGPQVLKSGGTMHRSPQGFQWHGIFF